MPKGKYIKTKEHRKKLSEAFKGRKFSLKSRKKMSEAHKGKKLPPASKERKRKISIALKGNKNSLGCHRSEETRRKISENKKGKKYSLELKKKLSLAHIGQIPWNKGIFMTDEFKKKVSKALKGRKLSKEHREKMSKAMKGRIFTKEWKEKISMANQERLKNPEYRKHMSEINSKEKSYLWRGGISFEPYGIEFNNKLREQIRKRDNYMCQGLNCYAIQNGKNFPVHHRDYDKRNNKPGNLITLCHSCHSKTKY